MIGITSMGYYIPMYRLKRDEIARMWRIKGIGGQKAVAGYDEDSITMAVAAVRDCLRRDNGNVRGLYFGSTTTPYLEKQSAAIIASAVGLDRECVTIDFTNTAHRRGMTCTSQRTESGGNHGHEDEDR